MTQWLFIGTLLKWFLIQPPLPPQLLLSSLDLHVSCKFGCTHWTIKETAYFVPCYINEGLWEWVTDCCSIIVNTNTWKQMHIMVYGIYAKALQKMQCFWKNGNIQEKDWLQLSLKDLYICSHHLKDNILDDPYLWWTPKHSDLHLLGALFEVWILSHGDASLTIAYHPKKTPILELGKLP